jgi:uncharacterized Tic20 family protein
MKQPEIGKVVTQLRLQKGMTQEKLAESCEVSTRTIQRIESGEVDPRTFTLNNLSTILEYDFNSDNKRDEKFWITALHLSSMFCIVIIPLLIWSFRKKNSMEINEHGKDVLNFQISMTLLLFVCAIFPGLTLLVMVTVIKMISFKFLILSAIPLLSIGFICFFQGLFNATKVLNDKPYKYILSIPFLK